MMTLQFEEGGTANGTGGCNDFSTTYEAGDNGSLTFGPILSTKMACEGVMELEQAYFDGLAAVQQFERPQGELILSSQDGKTRIVLMMPPK